MNRKATAGASRPGQTIRRLAAAAIALPLLAGCAAPGTSATSPDTLSAVTVGQPATASVADTEQAEIASRVKVRAAAAKAAKKAADAKAAEEAAAAAKKAADEAASAKAAEEAAAARAAEQAVAAKAASEAAQAKAVTAAPAPAPAPAPAADFMGWVNATMARYGVSPGPGASFVVGNTGFCGGYMCTTTQRYGTTPFQSLTTVSPGAIGNEFALIHEIAHQHGVGFKDSGGECAADVWARQYVQGSIYC